ncbi:MAG TPA: response regulator transcription factor [Clostridiales bacterium]|nr:response regulator transcription factor [Clostridiales bacterium]
MSKNIIKILIADDHDLIRQGLRRIISFEEDIKIIGEAENGQKVLEILKFNRPDVVLLDLNMPIMNGIEALRKIKILGDDVRVIMLTVENDKKTIYEVIKIGADGYMLKDSVGTEIVDAIRTVYQGEKYIDKSLISIFFMEIRGNKSTTGATNTLDNLSKREIEVLMHISKGLSNKEIGAQLYISEKTVKNYSTSLFRKLNVNDRVQAAILAVENDIEHFYKSKFQI